MTNRYTVVLTPDVESGGYSVRVPALPGCFTHGDTVEESIREARGAIACHLELSGSAYVRLKGHVEVIIATVTVAAG